MIPLPRALASWAPWLEGWAPAVVPSFAALLGRIEGWLGPGPRPDPAPDGPPAGFDGISRAGPYTRLLTSEWLLAEEAPDEFLRRAVDREHAFVHLARENPRPRRGLVALFDAGPAQLGQPRLVHLALLVVLARRAERARTHLRWGLLQSPARHEGAGADAIRALIAGRSANLPPVDAVGRDDLGADELWIIGGPETDDVVAPRARRLYVEDAPGTGPLTLRERGRGGALDLAPVAGPVAAKLLRDPFAPNPTPARPEGWAKYPVGRTLPDTLRVVPGCQHVLGWHPGGEISAWRLPPAPRGDTLRYRIDDDRGYGARIAAGWYQDRVLSVWLAGPQLVRHGRGLRGRIDTPAGLVPDRGILCQVGARTWFTTDGGRLWCWGPDGCVREPVDGVVGLFQEAGVAKALRRAGRRWSLHTLPGGDELGSFEADDGHLWHAPRQPGEINVVAVVGRDLQTIALRRGWAGGARAPIGRAFTNVPILAPGRHIGAGLFLQDRRLFHADGTEALRLPRRPRLLVASGDGSAVVMVTEDESFEIWSVATRSPASLRFRA